MIPRWLVIVSCLILALTLPPSTIAKKHKVEPKPYELEYSPFLFFYFEDSETVLMNLKNGNLMRSTDAGEHWEIDDQKDVAAILAHPFDNEKAYILGRNERHWVTTNQGETWKPFDIPGVPYPGSPYGPFSFHGWDSSKVIFAVECQLCSGVQSFYTTDDFETVQELGESAAGCKWAVGDPLFGKHLDIREATKDRTLCIVPGLKDRSKHGYRLLYSDNYFHTKGTEMKLQNGRPISGVSNVAAVKGYLVAAVESKGTSERALFVSIDTQVWHRAEFDGHRIENDMYTILESTNYSLQVNVLSNHHSGMGTLFTSNSNGTYFTRNIEHTNCNSGLYVDFEKVAAIQGIMLVNVVKNPEEVESGSNKTVVSKISFDDGKNFQNLKFDGELLHLHSVTTTLNVGRVFSSPAPGLVMGVGNTGDHLKDYSEGNLYISDDAGLNWRLALEAPHMYEFGDQGAVIMAIKDRDKTKEIQFSLDYGKKWNSVDLEHKISASALITTPGSTSLKFILLGSYGDDLEKSVVYSIDFEGLHERECEKDDFEPWSARLDENGQPDCLMGHQQFYTRRKANANCFVAKESNATVPDYHRCKCAAEDFECPYKRSEDGKTCVPLEPFRPSEGECRDPKDKFNAPSGWILIPGNDCIREGGDNLDDHYIKRPCEDVGGGSREIKATPEVFKGKEKQRFYMDRQASNSGDDETVMMLTTENEFWVSRDHGKNWEQYLKDEKIIEIVPHYYSTDAAFLLTDDDGKGFWTIDKGEHFQPFKAPISLNKKGPSRTLKFHPLHGDWLIWIGSPDCESVDCPPNAYISHDRGAEWHILKRSVEKCEFEYRENRPNSEYLIYCEQYEKENPKNRLKLHYSNDENFETWEDPFKNLVDYALVDYATQQEFVIVAYHLPDDDEDALTASVSVDGTTFADAKFPPNIVPVQRSYTALDSSTHAVFLYVTTKNDLGSKFGSIVKSNSNGTTFVLSLDSVNQNDQGYVDFERSQVLEGVIIANVVSNVEDLSKGEPKKLRTVITHNDGGEWALLPPPLVNADGKKFPCLVEEGRGTDKCSLHLHGYTERDDVRDTFSSGSALGLMLALGNVGDQLSEEEEPDTFMTRDGGVTWKSVKKGRYMWEYGDSGSVIVIVPKSNPTKTLFYSTDEGESWTEYAFTAEEVITRDITTVDSDNSRNFLLWTQNSEDDNGLTTINIDFSGLYDRKCTLEHDDFYLWQPRHPFQNDNCIFGHVEEYHRKKTSAQCWNNWPEPLIHGVGRNCSCTRGDYECDYNYERQSDGSCALVPGLERQDASAYCQENPDAIEYWEKTGYRRIPQTTCEGGQVLDRIVSKPCPGKQEEYDRKHGISGIGLFFAIVTPIAAASAVGYYVYTRWDGKFGQIRLGENVGASQGLLSWDSLFITIPIAVIAGVVAVAKAVPLLAMSLWRSANGYMSLGRGRNYSRPYASRGAFAARRGDYSSVVDDEDELLGVEDPEIDEEDEI